MVDSMRSRSDYLRNKLRKLNIPADTQEYTYTSTFPVSIKPSPFKMRTRASLEASKRHQHVCRDSSAQSLRNRNNHHFGKLVIALTYRRL